jgi:hypothetical protein
MSTDNQQEGYRNPAYDPLLRGRAHSVMTHVAYKLNDILRRRFDENSMYIEPTGVEDGGDVTGMVMAANNDVLRELEAEIARAKAGLTDVLDTVDKIKREHYGAGYNPMPHKL